MPYKSRLLFPLWLCLVLAAGAASAQEPPPDPQQEPQLIESLEIAPLETEQIAEVPPVSIAVGGVSETRFNPTYGAVFFIVSGGDLADAGRDARITADGRVLPSTRTSVSPRIVGGRYSIPPGSRRLAMSGWDAEGRPVEAEARIWAGELPLLVVVTDISGAVVNDARVKVSLDQQRGVSASRETRDGLARFENLPDERVWVAVTAGDGVAESRVVPASQGTLEIQLRR